MLSDDQVVELPGRKPATAQEFPRVPLRSRRVDETLVVRQAAADRHAQAEPPPFEREETHDRAAVSQDGDPGTWPGAADGHRELG